MKKRLPALALALLMLLSLAACGDQDSGSGRSRGHDKAYAVATDTAVATASAAIWDASQKSDSDLAYIRDKGTLVVGVTEFAPMDYQNDYGDWIGFDADLAREFADYLGVEPIFKVIDWNERALDLEDKSIDVVWNGLALTDEMQTMMACSAPYISNAQVVVLPNHLAPYYQTEDSLKTLRFVAEGGSAGFDALNEKGISPASVDDSIAALDRVAAGAYDACAMDLILANALIGPGNAYPDLTYTVELRDEVYTVGCRQDSDLVDALNTFLAQRYANGTTRRVADRYNLADCILNPMA